MSINLPDSIDIPGLYDRFSERSVSDSLPLYESRSDQKRIQCMSDLYAIIIAVERLEGVYAKGYITRESYVEKCKDLIAQFHVAERKLPEKMSAATFMKIYEMDCPNAEYRLLEAKTPEEMPKCDEGQQNQKKEVKAAAVIEKFITAMDRSYTNQSHVFDIQMDLSDVLNALVEYPNIPNDFEGTEKVRQWLQKLTIMNSEQILEEDDAKQLYFDLNKAYQSFKHYLQIS